MDRTVEPAPEWEIVCENVRKEFWSKGRCLRVIDRVDLEVKRNEFVVILGPGQCGKTTLLNIVAGLEKATTGRIMVRGRPVDGPGADRGVVFQSIALFPWKTVFQNVEMGPRLRGVPRRERVRKAQHYVRLVGLEGFEDRYPHELSGGMKQRVGIARAYCNDPVVMLMDEPFGHLDAQTRYMMEQELVRIWETERRTVVFVTNNIEEALYLADRVVVLSDCPTQVKAVYDVDLPRPRDYVDSRFLQLRREVSRAMEVSS